VSRANGKLYMCNLWCLKAEAKTTTAFLDYHSYLKAEISTS